MTSPTMTQAEFARALGLSKGRISQLVPEGLPVRKDGRINLARGKRWIDENLDPQRRAAAGKSGGKLQSVANLRAGKLALENTLADMEIKRRRGELIEREVVEASIFGRARFERDAWIGFARGHHRRSPAKPEPIRELCLQLSTGWCGSILRNSRKAS